MLGDALRLLLFTHLLIQAEHRTEITSRVRLKDSTSGNVIGSRAHLNRGRPSLPGPDRIKGGRARVLRGANCRPPVGADEARVEPMCTYVHEYMRHGSG